MALYNTVNILPHFLSHITSVKLNIFINKLIIKPIIKNINPIFFKLISIFLLKYNPPIPADIDIKPTIIEFSNKYIFIIYIFITYKIIFIDIKFSIIYIYFLYI